MGLLRSINEGAGRSVGIGGAGAVVFWCIVGGAVGFESATLLSLPTAATTVVIGTGIVLGLCLGFYAGLGITQLARVLALPGTILELLL